MRPAVPKIYGKKFVSSAAQYLQTRSVPSPSLSLTRKPRFSQFRHATISSRLLLINIKNCHVLKFYA